MVSIGTPTVYHFQTSVKIPENLDDTLISDKKRTLLKWANTAGVSSANLKYLWDHIIGDIVVANEPSNNVITSEIKDLKLTVESLKATIDELIVSHKCIAMKMIEQEKNNRSQHVHEIPQTDSDNHYFDDSDNVPPRKIPKISSKKKKSAAIQPSFDKSQLEDISDLEKELTDNNIILKKLKEYSLQSNAVVQQPTVARINKLRQTIDQIKEEPALLETFLQQTKCKSFVGVIEYFPVKTRQELNDMEPLLHDKEFTDKLADYLKLIKPTSVEAMPSQVRLLLHDDVTLTFSYLKRSSKESFKNHWLYDRIFSVWKESLSEEEFKLGFINHFSYAHGRARQVTHYKRNRRNKIVVSSPNQDKNV